jgi:hypothetical protein
LESLSYAEFLSWQLYAEREPFGPRREDERAGMIAKAAGHVATFAPLDFFPVKEAKQPLTVEESQQALAR